VEDGVVEGRIIRKGWGEGAGGELERVLVVVSTVVAVVVEVAAEVASAAMTAVVVCSAAAGAVSTLAFFLSPSSTSMVLPINSKRVPDPSFSPVTEPTKAASWSKAMLVSSRLVFSLLFLASMRASFFTLPFFGAVELAPAGVGTAGSARGSRDHVCGIDPLTSEGG
jgi:hypothetical protein